jgi:hypothetical protein
MLSIRPDFSALERAVLAAICAMHSADRAALEAQLSTAPLLSRENTGAGFYTRFAVERTSRTAITGARSRAGPQSNVDGLQHGMGFILWLESGFAHCLEGYSYGESTTGIILEAASFEVRQGQF